VERTLTDERIKDRASKLFVGLASECDPPNKEAEVGKILREKLAGASTLPFVGVLTPDGKWVHGFSGHRSAEKFLKDLDTIDASPLLNASPAVVKKLEKLLAAAQKSLAKKQWLKVIQCAEDAAELSGRHESRTAIGAAEAEARGVAEKALVDALEALTQGGDRNPVRKALFQLAKDFRGQPEAADAERGVKASERLARLAGISAEHRDAVRAKAAKEFAGSRWAALFGGEAPKQDE